MIRSFTAYGNRRFLGSLLLVVSGCAASTKSADFAQDTKDIATLPERIALSDAALGPGDEIAIQVYRHPDLTHSLRVPRSGKIFLPLVGEMDVMNVSVLEVRKIVTQRLDRYIVNPQVTVQIRVHRSRKVMVLGEVPRPGVFPLGQPMTALEAIVRAGGFTDFATRRGVLLLRPEGGRMVTHVLNLEKAIKKGEWAENFPIREGDILFVPKSTVTMIDRFAHHVSIWLSPILRAESMILLGYNVEDRINSSGIFIGN